MKTGFGALQRQGWQLSPLPDGVRLQCETPRSGWFLLQAQTTAPLRLRLNGFHSEIPLQSNGSAIQQLLFPSLQLQQLTLSGGIPAGLALRQVPAWQAYALMFATVSRSTGKRRLFDLCVARYRRAGWPQVRRKLLEAYQPLLLQLQQYADPYGYWLSRQPAPQPVARPSAQAKPPLIFVVTADPAGLWRHSLQSLERQSCPDWQLWLQQANVPQANVPQANVPQANVPQADGPQTNVPQTDPRILTQHQLQASACYWPLEPGDLLSPQAVAMLHHAISTEPDWQLLYSDHDESGAEGRRHAVFKPAFCYDSYLSRDYLSPALLYRGHLLQPLGEQCWQLPPERRLAMVLLQLSGPLAQHIRHLAWPLLQCAARPPLSAEQASVRQTALSGLRRQLILQQERLVAQVDSAGPDSFRLHYPLPATEGGGPLVSIVVPTRDRLSLTRTCIESVLQHTRYRDFEILLVDNQSAETDTLQWFAEISRHPQVRLLRYDAAFNYSAINNYAVSQSSAPFICLLNNDTEVSSPDWLDEMLQHAGRPQIGCVGAKLLFADNTVQHGGVVLGLWGLAGHSHKHFPAAADGYQHRLQSVQNYSAVTAACLLLRRELYLSVGGLNETALTVAFNDVDLCLKVQAAGYRNLWTPYAVLYHYESKSRGREDTPEKKARERAEVLYMQQQWPAQISDDHCYSPHLTRQREDYSIALDEPVHNLPLLR